MGGLVNSLRHQLYDMQYVESQTPSPTVARRSLAETTATPAIRRLGSQESLQHEDTIPPSRRARSRPLSQRQKSFSPAKPGKHQPKPRFGGSDVKCRGTVYVQENGYSENHPSWPSH